MAVEDKYIDPNLAVGDRVSQYRGQGIDPAIRTRTFEVAAADDDGSVYRLGRVHSSEVPLESVIMNDSIPGGTDYDLGLYDVGVDALEAETGSKDLFLDGATMATARAVGSGLSGLSAIPVADFGKPIWQLLGLDEDPNKDYDLAFTANTVGTGAGTITIMFETGKNG